MVREELKYVAISVLQTDTSSIWRARVLISALCGEKLSSSCLRYGTNFDDPLMYSVFCSWTLRIVDSVSIL
jgi:hypothetical protein